MKLKNAARFFDTCPVYDGYSGELLFKAQASTFMEASADGSTAARRVISLAPNLVIPEHACLLVLGQLIVVGHGNSDEWAGDAIRRGYWTKVVTDNFSLLTPAQAALGLSGIPTFGNKEYLTIASNSPTDAELDTVWNIHVGANTQALRGYFFKSGTTLYRVSGSFKDIDGFLTCRTDELDEPVVGLIANTSNSYNPVTDSYGSSVISTTCLILDYARGLAKGSERDYTAKQGDSFIVVSKAAMYPFVGQNLSVQSGSKAGSWEVIAISDEHDAWKLQARRF